MIFFCQSYLNIDTLVCRYTCPDVCFRFLSGFRWGGARSCFASKRGCATLQPAFGRLPSPRQTRTLHRKSARPYAATGQGSICFSDKIPRIFAKSLARRQPCCVLWLQYKKFCYPTKLRSTLKRNF